MEWMLIFQALIEAIAKCIDERNPRRRSRAQVEAGLLNPGLLEAACLRQILKDQFGLRGRELRRRGREGIEVLKSLPKEHIIGWCDEAEELNAPGAANA